MAAQVKSSNNHSLAQQRHAKEGSYFTERHRFAQLVIGICGNVGDVHDLAFKRYPPNHAIAARHEGVLAQERIVFGLEGVARPIAKTLAFADRNTSVVGTAQVRRSLDQCVEHWLQVESRATDDLQDIARGGLVFE